MTSLQRPRAALPAVLSAVLSAALLLGTAATALAGPWPHDRDGFTVGVNLGVGRATTETDGADEMDETIAGGAGTLRIGYAVSPAAVMSLEGIGWSNEAYGVTQSFSIGGLGLTWFPKRGGFWLKAVVGEGDAKYQATVAGAAVAIDESGPALSLGTGYEWRITRRLALGPAVDLVRVDFDRGRAGWANFTFGLQLYL